MKIKLTDQEDLILQGNNIDGETDIELPVISSIKKYKFDQEKGWLIAKGSNDTQYFVQMTELQAPNAPTIAAAERTKSVVVDGDTTKAASVTVTKSNTAGATNSYKVNNGNWTTLSGNTISLKPSFKNDGTDTTIEYTVSVKATKNYMESTVNTYPIYVKPKCANPVIEIGTVDNINGNCSVTIKPSVTVGATNSYTMGGSATSSTSFTEHQNRAEGYFTAVATKTGFDESELVESDPITFNTQLGYFEYSDNDDGYAESLTIYIYPSRTTAAGVVSSYNKDGGNFVTFNTRQQDTVTSSIADGKYKIRVHMENWTDPADLDSVARTVGLKKFYIGVGPETLTSVTDIKLGKDKNSNTLNQKKQTMAGDYTVEFTAAELSSGKNCLWICGAGKLSAVNSGPISVPMNSAITISGYNCYRMTNKVNEAGTYNYTVIN